MITSLFLFLFFFLFSFCSLSQLERERDGGDAGAERGWKKTYGRTVVGEPFKFWGFEGTAMPVRGY
jgi:hypothetical protein